MNIPDPPHCPDLYLPLTNGSDHKIRIRFLTVYPKMIIYLQL